MFNQNPTSILLDNLWISNKLKRRGEIKVQPKCQYNS